MAAFWATIVSYVLGVPARYYAYAAVAVGIFFVGCHCGRGFGAEPPNGAAQQFARYGDRGFEKDKPIDQRVVALEIKVELLQRQLADILWALEELDKKLPPSLKEAVKRKAGPCPVSGPSCTCGCVSGKPCNCAISHVADERLSRLDPQAMAYRDLCEWAEKHPGWPVDVYVQQDPTPYRYYGSDHYCRYDAGWPTIKTPTIIHAIYRDGQFIEVYRTPRATVLTYYQPLQRFGGNCPSGNCRSR